MSSSVLGCGGEVSTPVTVFEYNDLGDAQHGGGAVKPVFGDRNATPKGKKKADESPSREELTERITRERLDATIQAEQKLKGEFDLRLQAERNALSKTLKAFEASRVEYFAQVEAEIVQLALSIAAKILHRESQVDPMLVAALVKMTIDKMREGASITIRVHPSRARSWREYFAAQSNLSRVEIVEDTEITPLDCILETELGVTNFGLDSQLKEVERGFFDLLALKPVTR
jgi:flagellar assembly protein FliH